MARTDRRSIGGTAFRSEHEFREWLAKEHRRADGVVLRIYKKGSGVASITYAEALDQALCFGWIDGQKMPLDEKPGCRNSVRDDQGANGRRKTPSMLSGFFGPV